MDDKRRQQREQKVIKHWKIEYEEEQGHDQKQKILIE